MAEAQGSIRVVGADGHMAFVAPPPNDTQRYALQWDQAAQFPQWAAVNGGYGTSYGNFYGGEEQ